MTLLVVLTVVDILLLVAGLYGMAEEIVTDVTPAPERPLVPEPARPASGTRRSRQLDSVGFAPPP